MLKNIARLFSIGFFMGSADLVPGVSGGTIAFIFGIYEQLIDSIKLVSGKVLKLFLKGKIKEGFAEIPFGFLIPLGIGLATAVLGMSSLLSYLLETQPVFVWAFFFGLVVASVKVVGGRIKTWTPGKLAIVGAAALAAYIIVGAVPVQTPATLPAFFISGAIAICAMILPGISGSFLLLIMGKYEQILQAVTEQNFVVLGAVMIGAVIGLALFSRLLSWMFDHYHDTLVAFLTGFMIGSLRKIWPWKEVLETRIDSSGHVVPVLEKNFLPAGFNSEVIIALLLALAAMALILVLDKFQVVEESAEEIG